MREGVGEGEAVGHEVRVGSCGGSLWSEVSTLSPNPSPCEGEGNWSAPGDRGSERERAGSAAPPLASRASVPRRGRVAPRIGAGSKPSTGCIASTSSPTICHPMHSAQARASASCSGSDSFSAWGLLETPDQRMARSPRFSVMATIATPWGAAGDSPIWTEPDRGRGSAEVWRGQW